MPMIWPDVGTVILLQNFIDVRYCFCRIATDSGHLELKENSRGRFEVSGGSLVTPT